MGLRFTPGVTPVPVRVTVCGLLAALSVMVTEAARGPTAAGLNVTLIVQFAPVASVAGDLRQVFAVMAKSVGLAPVTAMVVIVRGAVPLSVRVMVCAGEVLPTCWAGVNARV